MPRFQTRPVCQMRRASSSLALCLTLIASQTLAFGTGASAAVRDAPSDPLRQKIDDFEENAPNMSEMLLRVSQKYGVRIGMDLGDETPGKPISVHLARGTVSDLIDATIAQTPGYTWAEVDGVVNVTPENGANSILDLRIRHFHVKRATPVAIHAAICLLPEVKTWLQQNRLTEHTVFGPNILVGTKGATNQPRVSLDLGDIPLRTILNRIAKSPGFRVWSVGRYENDGQYFTVRVD